MEAKGHHLNIPKKFNDYQNLNFGSEQFALCFKLAAAFRAIKVPQELFWNQFRDIWCSQRHFLAGKTVITVPKNSS